MNALALAFLAGAGLATQAFVNGRLGASLGSAPPAATVNQVVGLAALLAVATVTGATARVLRRLRAGARLSWWHLAASLNGVLFVTVSAAAAPKVGVAVLTVALVSGQTAGSLLVDRLGLSPAGGRPLTAARVLGVVLAVAAVAIGASGSHGDLHLGLLALAVVAGAGMAVVQAAVGHVARITGEPVVAGAVSFAVGAAGVLVLALVVTGGAAPNGWSAAPPEEWIGGLIGACTVVVMAWTVQTLGVLRLTLGLVAGQSVGAIAIDLLAPAAGEAVTLATAAGVALTIVAVAVSGTRRGIRRPARLRTGREGRQPTESPGPADRA